MYISPSVSSQTKLWISIEMHERLQMFWCYTESWTSRAGFIDCQTAHFPNFSERTVQWPAWAHKMISDIWKPFSNIVLWSQANILTSMDLEKSWVFWCLLKNISDFLCFYHCQFLSWDILCSQHENQGKQEEKSYWNKSQTRRKVMHVSFSLWYL